MTKSRRHTRSLTLMISDLDYFKDVNDRFGHSFSNLVLTEIASLVLGELRQTDVLARYGGDEFTILLPDTGIERAAIVAERIREQVSERRFHYHRVPQGLLSAWGPLSSEGQKAGAKTT